MTSHQESTGVEVLDALRAAIAEGTPVALATVIDVQGASPARAGFKIAVRIDGGAVGNVGGGPLEHRIRRDAAASLADGRPQVIRYRLAESGEDAVGVLCGGEVSVFIEPHLPRPAMLIVGGGHIGQPLAEMASTVGYDVHVVDIRPERGDMPHLDPAAISASTYVVLMTQDHLTDEAALHQALASPARYIGMIGSRQKAQIILEHLRAEGATPEMLARVRAPIGLDTGGREPGEIALAILAEIECVRHGADGRPRFVVLPTTDLESIDACTRDAPAV